MGEGGPDTDNTDMAVSDALLGRMASVLSTHHDSCPSLPSPGPTQSKEPSAFSSLDKLQTTDLIDPRIRVIPVDSVASTPSSCDSPPLYRSLELPPCASTSHCSAINEDYLIPNNEIPLYYSPFPHKDFTASESCSLVLPGFGSKSNLSDSQSAILAICRICHMPGDEDEILISPCRCAGTLQFIHNTCLQVKFVYLSFVCFITYNSVVDL